MSAIDRFPLHLYNVINAVNGRMLRVEVTRVYPMFHNKRVSVEVLGCLDHDKVILSTFSVLTMLSQNKGSFMFVLDGKLKTGVTFFVLRT